MVVKLHRKRTLPLQQGHGALHGLQRVAWVDGVDQVCDEFAVTVGLKGVTAFLQLSAQGVVVVHMPWCSTATRGSEPGWLFGPWLNCVRAGSSGMKCGNGVGAR
jgi:hypothetical protein